MPADLTRREDVDRWISAYVWNPDFDYRTLAIEDKIFFERDLRKTINLLEAEMKQLQLGTTNQMLNHAGGVISISGFPLLAWPILAKFAPVVTLAGAALAAIQYARSIPAGAKIGVLEARLQDLKLLQRRIESGPL